MASIVDQRFREWTQSLSPLEARISIYERIRDIPYAVEPDLANPARYAEMLTLGCGSCMPKHLLLSDMYQRLGLVVLLVTYPFSWLDVGMAYPPHLSKMARSMPMGSHLACRVEIEGRLVLVDATIDLPLEPLGVPVNRHWDGVGDTLVPIQAAGEEQWYHPTEVVAADVTIGDERLTFYRALNSWLEGVREHSRRLGSPTG